MKKNEIIQELKRLHDRMVSGGNILPNGKLIQAVFEAAELVEGQPEIFYLCDGKSCSKGCRSHLVSGCQHTANPMHAKNFILIRPGRLFERDPADKLVIDEKIPDELIVEV